MDGFTKFGLAVLLVALVGALYVDWSVPTVKTGSTPAPHPSQTAAHVAVLPDTPSPAAALHTTPSTASHTVT